MHAYVEEGLSLYAIAERYGIGIHIIRRRLHDNDVTMRPAYQGQATRFPDDRLIQLHDQGLHNAAIARELDVSNHAVAKRLEKLGRPPNKWKGRPARGRAADLTDEELRWLYLSKQQTVQEIADAAGSALTTVYERLRRMDVTFRKRGPHAGLPTFVSWSRWWPLREATACAPQGPGVYVARTGSQGPVVYVGAADKCLQETFLVDMSGDAAASGLGTAALNHALADAAWLQSRATEVEKGRAAPLQGWVRAALDRADVQVCWAEALDGTSTRALEERVIAALAPVGSLWNRAAVQRIAQ